MPGRKGHLFAAAVVGAVLGGITLFLQPWLLQEMYTVDPSRLDVAGLVVFCPPVGLLLGGLAALVTAIVVTKLYKRPLWLWVVLAAVLVPGLLLHAFVMSDAGTRQHYRHLQTARSWDGRQSMRGFTLYHRDLSGLDLSGADLQEAQLYQSNLQGSDLSRANLSKAELFSADLPGVTLGAANLEGASMTWVDLTGADLRRANLRDADLDQAQLSGALLQESDLLGANLSAADLSGAELAGACFAGAVYTNETRWPEGFDPQAAGAVLARP